MDEHKILCEKLGKQTFENDYELYVEVFKYIMEQKNIPVIYDSKNRIIYQGDNKTITCTFGEINEQFVIQMLIGGSNNSNQMNLKEVKSSELEF